MATRYVETQAKSILNSLQGMGFRWSVNPYRGCVHGCYYCFARRYHTYLDLGTGEDSTPGLARRPASSKASEPPWRTSAGGTVWPTARWRHRPRGNQRGKARAAGARSPS